MILGWDVETIVPGHGPITDKQGVLALKGYFEYVTAAARKRFDAGMNADEAARDISLDAYRDWMDDERIVVNVHALYREFAGGGVEPNAMEMHARMARYRKERGRGWGVRK
jgi:cyclase